VLPWSPLGGGWLTGKYAANATPPAATRLGDNPTSEGMEAWSRRSGLTRTWSVIETLRNVASEVGATMTQVALAWLESRPAVTSVILGARTVRQLRENIAASDLIIDSELVERLDRASDPQPSDYPYGNPGIEQRTRTAA
jgi:aryl-alcohol dehydrogenase-like predicted oxidoreductase